MLSSLTDDEDDDDVSFERIQDNTKNKYWSRFREWSDVVPAECKQ